MQQMNYARNIDEAYAKKYILRELLLTMCFLCAGTVLVITQGKQLDITLICITCIMFFSGMPLMENLVKAFYYLQEHKPTEPVYLIPTNKDFTAHLMEEASYEQAVDAACCLAVHMLQVSLLKLSRLPSADIEGVLLCAIRHIGTLEYLKENNIPNAIPISRAVVIAECLEKALEEYHTQKLKRGNHG